MNQSSVNLDSEYLRIGHGVGKRSRPPTPYRRYGSYTEIQCRPREPHRLAKPIRILSEREAHTECQCRPHIVDTDTIADAIFADAISETSGIVNIRVIL